MPARRAAGKKDLVAALLVLETRKEVEAFLADLLTPSELKALSERWLVAQMLDSGEYSYREIAEKAPSSTATVTRVARFLKDMPYQGYRCALQRLGGAKS